MIPNGGGSIILIASMSASVSPIHFLTPKFRVVTAISLGYQRPTSEVRLLVPLGVTNNLRIFSHKRLTTPRKLVRSILQFLDAVKLTSYSCQTYGHKLGR